MQRPERRTPVSHNAKSRDGVTRTVAESPAGEYSDQCSSESISDCKQFDEHKKTGIGAAIADVKSANLGSAESNLPKIETLKISEKFEELHTSWAWGNLRQPAEIERFILSLQEANMETARTKSLWEDAQNIMNCWSYAAEEKHTTRVGSGDTTLLIARHTAGNTSQST